jgi:hypothetical protein
LPWFWAGQTTVKVARDVLGYALGLLIAALPNPEAMAAIARAAELLLVAEVCAAYGPVWRAVAREAGLPLGRLAACPDHDPPGVEVVSLGGAHFAFGMAYATNRDTISLWRA